MQSPLGSVLRSVLGPSARFAVESALNEGAISSPGDAAAGLFLSGTHTQSVSLPLIVVLAVAGIISAALTGIALAAFVRRRSRSYLLIVFAVAALLGRTVLAGGVATNLVAPTTHHLLEHALDVVMAGLVVAAVYYARRVKTTVGGTND